jgi:glycerol uptake facilitator-like aquaporin
MLRERRKIAIVMAEFLGAALLTTLVLSINRIIGNAYFVALALGITLAALVMLLGRVSAVHVNPAITIAMWSARQIKASVAIVFVAAQLLGGIMAYLLYTYLTNQHWSNTGSFDSRVLVAEAAGAFVLAMGVAASVYNRYEGARAAFTVGGALAVGIMVAMLASQALINPAVALGARSWVWGTYVLGPILGAVIGFNLYALLFAPQKALVEAEAKADGVRKK